MKDEKKVNKTEEVKEEVKPEENGVKLDDKQLEGVTGGCFEYVVDLPELGACFNYDRMSFSTTKDYF